MHFHDEQATQSAPIAQAGQAQQGAGTIGSSAVPSIPTWLERWKDVADATSSSLTAVGLVVAAVWTWLLFVRRRQRVPRANVEHRVQVWPADGALMLHASVRVINVGDVLIRLETILARVQQLVPMPDDVQKAVVAGRDPVQDGQSEVQWPLVAERECTWKDASEIEPSESDEFHFDFVVPADVQKVLFYTHVINVAKKKRAIGWNTTSFCDVIESQGNDQQTCIEDGSGKTETASTSAAEEGTREMTTRMSPGQSETRQGPPKPQPPRRPATPTTTPPPSKHG